MIHSASPQSRPALIVAWFWSFGTDGRTDGRTDTLCENSDHYRPGLWSASWINIRKKTWQWLCSTLKVTKCTNVSDIRFERKSISEEKYFWPTRPRPNRWSLFSHSVSVRPAEKNTRATTLTSRPGRQQRTPCENNYHLFLAGAWWVIFNSPDFYYFLPTPPFLGHDNNSSESLGGRGEFSLLHKVSSHYWSTRPTPSHGRNHYFCRCSPYVHIWPLYKVQNRAKQCWTDIWAGAMDHWRLVYTSIYVCMCTSMVLLYVFVWVKWACVFKPSAAEFNKWNFIDFFGVKKNKQSHIMKKVGDFFPPERGGGKNENNKKKKTVIKYI